MAGEVEDGDAAGVLLRLEHGEDVVERHGEAGDQLAAAGALGRLVQRLQLLMLQLELFQRAIAPDLAAADGEKDHWGAGGFPRRHGCRWV